MLSVMLLMVLLLPMYSAAQDDDDQGQEQDPSTRIARISYVRGPVSFEPAGTQEWVNAVVNRPVTTGDKLWTDNGARAELQLGSATVRLASTTGFSFLNLSDYVTQIRLTEGTLNVRVRRLDENETFEIDTPNLAFSVLRPGRYRIDVNENGDSTAISVIDGQGEVTGGGSAYNVQAGDTATFSGLDQLSANVEDLVPADDFDEWCMDRDRRENHSISARYVDTDVVGYSDLDDYGGWRPVPEYGTVWFPHVTVTDWAPYRYGHWAWIAPWGWTWVDDEPWGFAPFHYGRWVMVDGVWGWIPCPPRAYVGVAYVRPVYAPALVAWVGGPHFAVGIGVGSYAPGVNVGWFPLGPREVYVPSYNVSRTYINNVNISNTTINQTVINNYYHTTVVNNATNVRYVNRSAVTVTTPATFTSARPVAQNMVRVNNRKLVSAPVAVRAPSVAPTQQSVTGAGRQANVRPPASLSNRAVVAKTAPPPTPLPFAKQQKAIEANGGRPLPVAQVRQMERQNEPAARPNIRVAPRVNTAAAVEARRDRAMQQEQGNANSQANRPNAASPNRPSNAGNSNLVYRPPAENANREPNGPSSPANPRQYNDRPPSARPLNTPLDQKQARQMQQLHEQQDRGRAQLEQEQQRQDRVLRQEHANEERRQQATQQQERQLQQMEQRHDQQQQELRQEQRQEREQQRTESRPAPQPHEQSRPEPPQRRDQRQRQ